MLAQDSPFWSDVQQGILKRGIARLRVPLLYPYGDCHSEVTSHLSQTVGLSSRNGDRVGRK